MPNRNKPLVARYARPIRLVFADLVSGVSANRVALGIGVSQGHVNDVRTGKKPVTIELLDQVARWRELSVTQMLTRLRDASLELDRVEPGWDVIPLDRQVRTVEEIERAVKTLEREQSSRRKATRAGTRRQPPEPDEGG